ncbi:MAG: competence/damage-inducible protein A [Rhodobiaceae bacterium]|jgi:nicotinamide-nucleotide amidase|nr:competence/damage-inducible protein A [Rhodobiaceae bacterium]MBT5640945.1 competence/damage-inducible protein A [Rhodobiaceae bacterium]MBT6223316.1 competence/damage-inducible protein A [Rhodobiaceae bacterium]MDB4831628.1 competence/damage-inducible protein A [Hyphomicrobiales bacterium]MDC3272512.1 competence/damage-inducible protein A [Hyphomicrobiales bacterium]|tara:strand:+ start:297 stop:1544 length:1248 start_codon:yes stop_codon:yes gene_type:complete
MQIEIICTGDEILSGKIINSNFSYMSRKLEEVGLSVVWGTTVGDDRKELLDAFILASKRSDAVIVNGGLGPTVDDLSQEIAAEASGMELELREDWLSKMEGFFTMRGRTMTENNKKQAMLPKTSELIDNPVGTACGFAINIKNSRFFFTPGVPRELFRMLENEIIPRLLALSGEKVITKLKTFHSYGIGESRADSILNDSLKLSPDNIVKLGFQAHYPQLETKLYIKASSLEQIEKNLKPVENDIRKKLNNFIFAEDKNTLEGVITKILEKSNKTIAIVELKTNGGTAARLSSEDPNGKILKCGIFSNNIENIYTQFDIQEKNTIDLRGSDIIASRIRNQFSVSYGLSIIIKNTLDNEAEAYISLSDSDNVTSRIGYFVGDEQRIRLGAVEMALDCLRRYLQDLPFNEKSDFEKL